MRIVEPALANYEFPDPCHPRFFRSIPALLQRRQDSFSVYCISHSLFERASSLRGPKNLMMDFYDHPDFVHKLLNAIADWSVQLACEALRQFDIDAVYFGDDWGQQRGLQMGPRLRREF